MSSMSFLKSLFDLSSNDLPFVTREILYKTKKPIFLHLNNIISPRQGIWNIALLPYTALNKPINCAQSFQHGKTPSCSAKISGQISNDPACLRETLVKNH